MRSDYLIIRFYNLMFNICAFLIMELHTLSAISVIFVLWLTLAESTDLPCAALPVKNRSVLCVCTADYCDTITREAPVSRRYVTYVSSEAGLRFNKTTANLQRYKDKKEKHCNTTLLEVDPTTKYQTINGFGGAVTDAAGINWKNLSNPQLMQNLIESYCGDTGIQYNMLRVPIGGTDFSTRAYAYNELPEDDLTLSNFTLSYEDYEYKIPMIKACMKAASAPVHIVSATWSPPVWMKTNNNYTGYSRLKKKYLQAYADYHYKFIEKYAEEDIPVWGISTTNEPLDGTVDYININKLGWTLDYMGEWIEYNLGPTIRNSSFKDVKILAGDDQRFVINLYWNALLQFYPGTLKYLDGVAVHWYMNKYTPASILTQAMKDYPDKFVIATEASAGYQLNSVGTDLGSWSRAEDYVADIIENLSHNVIGWMDWNMCLNTEGGPNWTGLAVDSPIIVNSEAGEFYKQPMFYAIGHFSKFVPRGSRRIKVTVTNETNIQNIAFLTPNNIVVVVLYNSDAEKTINIRLGEQEAVLLLEAKSFTTVEMYNDD